MDPYHQCNRLRRTVLVGGVTGLGLAVALAQRAGVAATGAMPDAAPDSVVARAVATLEQLETEAGGRVGVAALDLGSGARLAHRGGERFAMCSTFKWLLAAAVLDRQDRTAGVLDARLHFTREEVLPHSPVTSPHGAGGTRSVRRLCAAVVEESDNTAANTLLRFIGGPAALTQFLRDHGDLVTRLDRIEMALNENALDDPRDTTTPAAMVGTLRTLLLGDALSAASREQLLTWMRQCRTGADRLRAGLPAAWRAGDKTGTGARGAVNDVAIAWPPGRPPILVAAYLSDSSASVEALSAIQARIGTAVASAFA